jgi:hypothetical protein
MRIEGQPPGEAGASSGGSSASGSSSAGAPLSGGSASGGEAGQACPQCGTAKTGMFCEVCGFDYASGTPKAPDPLAQPDPGGFPYVGTASATNVVAGTSAATAAVPGGEPQAAGPAWTAVVTADRDYFDSVVAAGGPDAASIEFPGYCPERRFTLAGQEVRIGRRSASRGLDPEIDLTGPPTDPGVSHLHAVLIAQPDGTWSVLDPGSSNGTQVNGTDLVTGAPVALHSGDRVSLGAWTVLTIASP